MGRGTESVRREFYLAIELKDSFIPCHLRIEPPPSPHEHAHTLVVKRFFSGKQVFLRDEPLLSSLSVSAARFSKRGIFVATLKGRESREGWSAFGVGV